MMEQSVMIINNIIHVNGKPITNFPKHNTTHWKIYQTNKAVYINGYKYVDGQWKKTIISIFHYLFS